LTSLPLGGRVKRRLQTVVNVPFGKINHFGVAEHDTSMSDIVREALVNFCQHADFFSPLRSSIHVFLNRIEFLNAGSFPVALNKMIGKFFSMARNPGISKMSRWADLCENEGFGMDELLSWQKITNSKVEIESEREFSRVILYLPKNGSNLGANDIPTTQIGANLGANDIPTTQIGANLGANKQRILHAIQIDNTLSVLKLQLLTDIPLRTLQREINELIELGALEKGGTRKNIIWTIKNM
jgi:ATP-dependent DNA helicase RecG